MRRRFITTTLAALVLVTNLSWFSTPALADDGNREEYDQLFNRMLDEPADLDVMFAFAEEAIRLGEYDAAISTLERMLIYNPDLARVKLELGALYLRTGAPETARTYLLEAIERPDTPPAVRARVQAYIDEIDRRTSRHWFAGEILAGLRYQTNAIAATNADTVSIVGPGGIPVPATLDSRFQSDDDFDVFATAGGTYRYDFDSPHEEVWEARGVAYASRQFERTEVDVAIAELQTGPRLALLPNLAPGNKIHPFVLGNVVSLGGDRLYSTLGGGIELEHEVADDLVLRLDYVARYRDFAVSDERPQGDDRDGFQHRVGFGVGYSIMPGLTAFGQVSYLRDDAERGFEANTEYGATASLRYEYMPPFFDDLPPWRLTLAGGFRSIDYDDPNPAISLSQTREDDEWRLALTNTFRITRQWAVETQAQYTDHRSNQSLYEYDNFSLLAGVLFSF